MFRFINTELKSDSDSVLELDSEEESKFGPRIRHFTFNNFYSYVFVDFEQVILLLKVGHINPFLFMPIFLRENFLSKLCFRHTFC